MKNTYKSFALLCMGLAATACVEDNLEQNNGHFDVTPGTDIVFTATAHIEDGNAKPDTRTVYGEVSQDKTKIEVNWAAGDRIQIASPEAGGVQSAEYAVGFNQSASGYQGSHSATSIDKTGDVGLQWSGAETYNFYAMYPSPATFKMEDVKDEDNVFLQNVGLDVDNKTMTCWLPTSQYNDPLTAPEAVEGTKVIAPEMKYAYMHASASYQPYVNEVANTNGITLPFNSAVTALQFAITGNTVDAPAYEGHEYITIRSVSLSSKSKLNLVGKFKYDFKDGTYSDANGSTGGYDIATVSFGSGYTLEKDEKLDITFFILPRAIPAEDLKIQITFSVGDDTQPVFKTATLKNAIQPGKKYFYESLLLPAIEQEITGSNWVSALNPNTYLTQLSVPVAGNAFSSYYAGDNQEYNIEQVLNYQELWNAGVRGFEFKTAQGYNPANNTSGRNYTDMNTVAGEYFVTNGQEMTAGPTFDEAFTYLAQQIMKEEYKEEFLVIIATYQSYTGCGAYDPQEYVNDLETYFKNKTISYTYTENGVETKVEKKALDMIVKLTSNSVVGDLKGKIAVVVRPGDDEFIAYSNKTLTLPTDTKLMYVQNWGTAVDCWDRRFSGYNRQMVFGRGSAETYIENYLYAIASNNTGDTPETTGENTSAFKAGYPATNTLTDDLFKFNNGGYLIQEFARVVPENDRLQNGFYADVSDSWMSGFLSWTNRYLWVRWPESFTQKTDMIDYILDKSIATKGKTDVTPLFINSLSGYYVTEQHKHSYLPYAGNYTLSGLSFSCSDAGMGGDMAGLAADLNIHLYNKLVDIEQTHNQGPLGLIVMNYIGAKADHFDNSDYYDEDGERNATWAANAEIASRELPNMIVMNNFKFPMSTSDGTPTSVTYNAAYVDGGEAISFE